MKSGNAQTVIHSYSVMRMLWSTGTGTEISAGTDESMSAKNLPDKYSKRHPCRRYPDNLAEWKPVVEGGRLQPAR